MSTLSLGSKKLIINNLVNAAGMPTCQHRADIGSKKLIIYVKNLVKAAGNPTSQPADAPKDTIPTY